MTHEARKKKENDDVRKALYESQKQERGVFVPSEMARQESGKAATVEQR